MACDKRERFPLSSFTVYKAQRQPHGEGCAVLSRPAALMSSSQPPAPLQEVARLPLQAHSIAVCLGHTRATAFTAVFPQLEKPQARPAGPHREQPAGPLAFTFTGSLCQSPGSSAMTQTMPGRKKLPTQL